jgi:hypothetical protein
MELPKWAFKTESRANKNGSIDLVIGLRPLGRLWLYSRAIFELIRTATLTLTIEFQEGRPVVTHDGERVEPSLEYSLEANEVDELVNRVPTAHLPRLMQLAEDRYLFASTPERRAVVRK